MNNNIKNIDIAFFVALVASFISCTSDVLLLYVPGENYFNGEYTFYRKLCPTLMIMGHYLGIVFIPLQSLAVPWISKRLKIKNTFEQLTILILLIYTIIMGCVYHSSCALMGLGLTEQLDNEKTISLYNSLFMPPAMAFIVGIALVSAYLSLKIFYGKSDFNKYLSIITPINIAIIIYAIDYFTSFEMGWATVSAFNLSILIFLISAWLLDKKGRVVE